MHIIKHYESPVTLFSQAGVVRHFASKKALLTELGIGWISRNVGKHFREFSHDLAYLDETRGWVYRRVYTEYPYVIRDGEGSCLAAGDFSDLVARRRRVSKWRKLLEGWNGEGPVPGIHRPRNASYFRKIKTTNERRWATPIIEDGEPAPRAARNHRNIPNSWDDYGVAAREDINWKHFRKTQWKATK